MHFYSVLHLTSEQMQKIKTFNIFIEKEVHENIRRHLFLQTIVSCSACNMLSCDVVVEPALELQTDNSLFFLSSVHVGLHADRIEHAACHIPGTTPTERTCKFAAFTVVSHRAHSAGLIGLLINTSHRTPSQLPCWS